MANESETVREVCAEMRYDIVHDAEWFADRILSAYERELAAKDAEIKTLESVCRKRVEDLQNTIVEKDKIINRECEYHPGRCGGGCLVWKKCAETKRENEAKDAEIARLKQDKKCDWNSNRCGGGCLVWDENVKLSKEIARLKAALKPVMDACAEDAKCDAVREAQRVMREGGEK